MNRRRVTVIDPDDYTAQERDRVDRWLVANGARYQAILEPITITHTRRGDVIEYVALCKRNGRGPGIRPDRDGYPVTRRRSVWQRVPLGEVA